MLSRVKPACLSRFSLSAAAPREVTAVAPGHRGCDTIAIRPPGASRPRSSASRSAGAGQNPRELTARMASKGPVERGRQPIDRRVDQGDPTGPDRRGVALGRLPQHDRRMVDAVDVTGAGTVEFGDCDAGSEADLKDAVGRAHVEQRDRPAAALPVGRAVRHHTRSPARPRPEDDEPGR